MPLDRSHGAAAAVVAESVLFLFPLLVKLLKKQKGYTRGDKHHPGEQQRLLIENLV